MARTPPGRTGGNPAGRTSHVTDATGQHARPHAEGAAGVDRRPQAVALRYDDRSAAPRVVAKGYGTIADNIIQTAKDHGLYVHESPELVNVLMKLDLDQQIPPELYLAIAELLAWLYHLEGKSAEDLEPKGDAV